MLVASAMLTKRNGARLPPPPAKAISQQAYKAAGAGPTMTARNAWTQTRLLQSAAELSSRLNTALYSKDGEAWEAFCRDTLPDLIRDDPSTVAAVVIDMPAGYEREEALRLVCQGWGSQNGFAAMDWAAGLSETDDRASSMANVSIGMSQADPANALVTARQYGVVDNGGLYQNMVALWAERDAAGAFDWVDTLPGGPEKDAMMERVAFAASKTSPADAAILATSEISDGPIRDDAVLAVLHQWAMRDLAAASSWVMQFPQGQLRDRAEAQLQSGPGSG